MSEQEPGPASENPFAPPAAAESNWAPPPQPTPVPAANAIVGPKVYGVLSIVFASLTLVLTLFGQGVGVASVKSEGVKNLITKPYKDKTKVKKIYDRYYQATAINSYVQSGIWLFMSAALLGIGVGQLRYRRWARRATVVWAAVALVSLVGFILVWYLYIAPSMKGFYEALAQQVPSGSIEETTNRWMASLMGGPLIWILTALVYAPYPLLLLIYFTRDKVKAAMGERDTASLAT